MHGIFISAPISNQHFYVDAITGPNRPKDRRLISEGYRCSEHRQRPGAACSWLPLLQAVEET